MGVGSIIWAALDIGTNSVKLLVGRVNPSGYLDVLHQGVRVTRMGEGLFASGRLGELPVQRALEAIKALLKEALAYHPQGISALGMEAFRRAQNGAEIAHRIEKDTQISVRILRGTEEADLGREGVLLGYGGHTPDVVLVADIGGGSTELALTIPRWEISVPHGAVTTTEAFLSSDPPTAEEMERARQMSRKWMTEAWSTCPARDVLPTVVAVGGTVTTFGAIYRELDSWAPEQLHGLRLGFHDVEALTDHLAALSLERRREVVGLDQARAPVIVGGGTLLEAILLAVGAPELRISVANLLHAHVVREVLHWYAEHTPQNV